MAGNCTSVTVGGVTTTLTWDGESRLKSVTKSGQTTTYTYNGLGQRTRQVSGGTTLNYTLADDSIDASVLQDGVASYVQVVVSSPTT